MRIKYWIAIGILLLTLGVINKARGAVLLEKSIVELNTTTGKLKICLLKPSVPYTDDSIIYIDVGCIEMSRETFKALKQDCSVEFNQLAGTGRVVCGGI